MLKVMILDDEALPRIALHNIVSKKHTVSGEAASCSQGIAMAKATRPDVVLVDIVLTDKDGFEFIKDVSAALPDTKYVIISNVESIDNLKKALKAKAYDFILKGTLTEEKLLNVLDELEQEILKSREQHDVIPDEHSEQMILSNFLQNTQWDMQALSRICGRKNIDIGKDSFYIISFLFLDSFEMTLFHNMMYLMDAIITDSGSGLIAGSDEYSISCLFSSPEDLNPHTAVKDLCYRIITTIKNTFDVNIAAGVSDLHECPEALHEAYTESVSACSHSFISGKPSISFYCADEAEKGRKDLVRLKKALKNELQSISPSNITAVRDVIRKLKENLQGTSVSKELIIGLYFEILYYVRSDIKYVSGTKNAEEVYCDSRLDSEIGSLSLCKTLDLLNEACLEILSSMDARKSAAGSESEVVRQIKSYISEHISEQLSLEEIANHIYMNPTYVSQLFKQKTGIKLRRYIINQRIKYSEKFLREGKSIHETAILAGFTADSYFIQCFRNSTGMTPREYFRKYNISD